MKNNKNSSEAVDESSESLDWNEWFKDSPDDIAIFFSKVIKQSELVQQIAEAMTAKDFNQDEWQNHLEKDFKNSIADLTQGLNHGLSHPSVTKKFKESVSQIWAMYEDTLKVLNISSFLNVPFIEGQFEHEQAHHKIRDNQHNLLKAFERFQTAQNAFNLHFKQFSESSFSRLELKIKEVIESKQQIQTVQQFISYWLDACEAEYENLVRDANYAELYGELVNAKIALKKQWKIFMNSHLEMLNLPNRNQLDSLENELNQTHKKTQQLEIEIAELKGLVQQMIKGSKKS